MNLRSIAKWVLNWRILLSLAGIFAIWLLPIRPDFMLKDSTSKTNIFTIWANFDGMHYLELAKYWYGSVYTNYHYAFFPVYPWLIRTFNFFNSYLATGLVFSHIFLIFSLYFLYRLIIFDSSSKVAKSTILVMLLFPTSFFFGSVYTESFFLFLSVLTFYCARKNNFFLAAIFASIASATRITGIFLLPALMIEFYLANKSNIKSMITNPKVLSLLIAPIGLWEYLQYQYLKTGDYLFFIHQQPGFGANRAVDKLILIHQVFFRYFKMMIFVDHTSLTFITVLIEFLIAAIFFILCLLAIKKIRLSYTVYCLLSFALPTLTGTFSSMPRYVLVLFPLFIILGDWYQHQNPKVQKIYQAVNIVFSLICVAFFTRGYFIG